MHLLLYTFIPYIICKVRKGKRVMVMAPILCDLFQANEKDQGQSMLVVSNYYKSLLLCFQ
jgi:hypothetical protein